MKTNASKIIRRTHMYLALFLTPWLIIYALSGFVLNHGPWFTSSHGAHGAQAAFEKVEERDYVAEFSKDADVRMIGAQVLEHLGLSGAFNVQGGVEAPKLVIMRNAAFTVHRVTYFRETNRLLVERQALPATGFLNRSHFRHGYGQPFVASILWAVVVDLVVIALIFWVASGIWMWWEIKPARIWGAVFGLVGVGLFAVLLFTI